MSGSDASRALAVVLAVLLVGAVPAAGLALPAGAAGEVPGLVEAAGEVPGLAETAGEVPGLVVDEDRAAPADGSRTGDATGPGEGSGTGRVGVGQQLATVVAAESETVQGAVDREGFAAAFERANDTERADLLVERAGTLTERAATIRADYREATEAYREGEIDESAYAQRIAMLNARAEDLLESVDQFRDRAARVPTIELRAAGLDRSALRSVVADLEAVVGTGPRALLARFTGERTGELAIERENATLTISVASDGERSRELERDRDDDPTIAVNQSAALATARGALSDVDGRWTLEDAGIDTDEGVYAFEFELVAGNLTGTAEVSVDGSSGAVFALEEEIETADDPEDRTPNESPGEGDGPGEDEDEEGEGGEDEDPGEDEGGEDEGGEDEDPDRDEDDGEPGEDEDDGEPGEDEEGEGPGAADLEDVELSLVVHEGTPGPGETVTIRVLADGTPVGNATVSLGDRVVGTTGPNGTVAVTLPPDGATVAAVYRDAEAELEFEFGDGEDPVYRALAVDPTYDDGSVTVTVTYDGRPLRGATVAANGDRVGTTGGDGTVAFETGATEELELAITKGEFEAEYTYAVENGSLVLVESPLGEPGSGDDEDERDEDEDGEEDDEGREDENGDEGTDDEAGDDEPDDGRGSVGEGQGEGANQDDEGNEDDESEEESDDGKDGDKGDGEGDDREGDGEGDDREGDGEDEDEEDREEDDEDEEDREEDDEDGESEGEDEENDEDQG